MSIDQLLDSINIHAHFRLAVSVTRYNRMASADTVLVMKGMAADPLKRKLLLKVHFYIINVPVSFKHAGTPQLINFKTK